jgi:hypothetical protein
MSLKVLPQYILSVCPDGKGLTSSSIDSPNQNFSERNALQIHNVFFKNSYILDEDKNAPLIEAAFSLTGLAQKSLQMAHNQLASKKQEVQHVLLRKIVIGAGFLGTIFLGVIETIVRIVIAFFVKMIGIVMLEFCSKHLSDLGRSMVIFSDASVEYTIYGIGQAAVSLWSHCSFSENQIDYELQAKVCLFSGSSEKSRHSFREGEKQLKSLKIITM